MHVLGKFGEPIMISSYSKLGFCTRHFTQNFKSITTNLFLSNQSEYQIETMNISILHEFLCKNVKIK